MKFEVEFEQRVVLSFVVTVEADSAEEAEEKVKNGDYLQENQEMIGESDEGCDGFNVVEVK